jgi:DNA-binding transcriptional regulator GbsR (MarR family)
LTIDYCELTTMNLQEAKDKFVNAWGTLGSNWGINRTMAQVHALLMVSSNPLSAEDIMAELNISRGNANMNVRDLINWGLVHKVNQKGERKEFFEAEKDIYKVAKKILIERKKREIDPIMKILSEVKDVTDTADDPDVKAFTTAIADINGLINKVDTFSDLIVKSDQHWFVNSLLKLMK